MSKTIRSVTELPAWFDLRKYQGLDEVDLVHWHELLLIRQYQWQIVADTVAWGEVSDKAFEIVRERPLSRTTDAPELKILFFGGQLAALRLEGPAKVLPVQEMTIRQLYLREFSLKRDRRAFARRFFSQIFSKEFLLGKINYKYKLWIDEPVNDSMGVPPGRQLPIVINMGLPDELLFKAFRAFVQEQRSRSDPDARGEKLRLATQSWVASGVLPYIDLTIWAASVGVKIPKRVMADAIFAPGTGGEEAVRKTTVRLAKDAISGPMSEALLVQGALEMLSGTEGSS